MSMLRSFFTEHNFLIAWNQIRKRKVPGIDGITPKDFEKDLYKNIKKLADEILCGYYVPSPLLAFNYNDRKKSRTLGILTTRDQLAQKVIAQNLSYLLDKEFLPTSFAYRPGKSSNDALVAVKKYADKKLKWIIKGDIKNFFDEIDREMLYLLLKKYFKNYELLNLIRKWLEVGFIKNNRLYKYPTGIPQGSPLSPFFSNLYLHQFDIFIKKEGFTMIRFSDDFVILTKNHKETKKAVYLTRKALRKLNLEIKSESFSIIRINQKFTFLGKEILLNSESCR